MKKNKSISLFMIYSYYDFIKEVLYVRFKDTKP